MATVRGSLRAGREVSATKQQHGLSTDQSVLDWCCQQRSKVSLKPSLTS